MHAGFTTQSGSSTPRWRIVSVRELTNEEKGDKHHVFINLRDQAGADARGATSIKSGWEGMDQAPIITPTDKQAPEPAANIPIFPNQKLWIEADAGTAESDRASGMDCFHAYEVVFQYDAGIALPNPAAHLRPTPEPEEPTRGTPETHTMISDPTAWTPPVIFFPAPQPTTLPESEPTDA
jgi:hypothetical protein